MRKTVIFEDSPKSLICQLFSQYYPDVEVLAARGAAKIEKKAPDTPSIAFIDICWDNPQTFDTFNKILDSHKPILPFGVPSAEYMYLLLCSWLKQFKYTEICKAAIQMYDYKKYNKYAVNTFERYCKSVVRDAVTGCAKWGKSPAESPRLLQEDCLCKTLSGCTVTADIIAKTNYWIKLYPVYAFWAQYLVDIWNNSFHAKLLNDIPADKYVPEDFAI